MLRMPSPSFAVSLFALIVALGGAGYSATGGTFILGSANSADASTRLTGSIEGSTLQLSNTSSKAAATALRLAVDPDRPPMAVTSSTLVAKFNADQLDGLNANQLMRVGRGYENEFNSGQTLADAAKIRLQIPQPGFVLATGTVTAVTTSTTCDPCYAHVLLTDKTSLEVSPVAIQSVGFGATETIEEVITVTWVFPVDAAGNRTFALRVGSSDPEEAVFANPVITALYVPFGAKGTLEVAGGSPQTLSKKPVRLGSVRSDGTRRVLP